jgi:Ca-activated chloride channel family protein
MVSFEHPWVLLSLLAVPLLGLLRVAAARRERKRLRRFVRPSLWNRVGISRPSVRPLSTALWLASLTAALLALAGPMWGLEEAVGTGGGSNLVVAVDVSTSMASRDMAPSRLGRAKAVVGRLAEELSDTRFAVVLFSERARLAVPLTMDREFLLRRIPGSPYDVGDLPGGTRLQNLVDVMAAVLPDMELESSAALILSDGGFHDYSARSAAARALDAGMSVSAVGIGGRDSVPVPDGRGGVLVASGDTVRTALNPDPLRELARATGGLYLEAAEDHRLPEGIRSLLGRAEDGGGEAMAPARRFHLLTLAAVLLAAGAWAAERRGS